MKRVLFVDDEHHVLEGLRDSLRRHRSRWELHFASEPRTAIEWIDAQPFDVVVSDMRMPGIDGAELLAHVRARQPASARIILSGQADRESVLRALPSAHQFLSKPCEPDALIVTIERACMLQRLLSDANIRDAVGRLDRLPSPPQLYWELTIAASRQDVGLEELAAIVERDPAMSLKVLQLVNSAYFGAANRVGSVQNAVARLGVDLLKALALVAHAFDALEAPPFPEFSIDALQRHSFMTARLAKQFSSDPTSAAEAFAAALLHDIGKLVLGVAMPEQFARVIQQQKRTRRPFWEVETEIMGITHAEVGAYLLGSWGLPLTMVETVAYHHTPLTSPEIENPVLAAVHMADALVDKQSYASENAQREGKLDVGFIKMAGHSSDLNELRTRAQELLVASRGPDPMAASR